MTFLWMIMILSLFCGLTVASPVILILTMEVTLFTFLFMMYSYKLLNYGSTCLKYFVVQSMASLMMLVSCAFNMVYCGGMTVWLVFMMLTGLYLKLGVFPMHFWVISVTEELPYLMLGTLGIPMKILPLNFLWAFLLTSVGVEYWTYVCMGAIGSMVIGLILGLSMLSIRGVLGASSITHSGWFLLALLSMDIIKYFLLYSMMLSILLWSLNYLNSILVSLSLYGLSGLPPFSIFFGKVLVLSNCFLFQMPLVYVVVALFTSIFSLFYYLKYSFRFYMINYKTSIFTMSFAFIFMVNVLSSFLLFLL
uniref:NADH-ubiquinone oxidoreductase chain 2 n=1 Tax=Dolicheulota formosensis TaxID=1632114 RepID=A0A0H3W550_DOLFO|nr:NADH dehydrogenase subunit 2 [Dolicheulota formosensis]AKJ85734.1 NADH dehydrogenase subunit 2 [Dolicheulota formosensis]